MLVSFFFFAFSTSLMRECLKEEKSDRVRENKERGALKKKVSREPKKRKGERASPFFFLARDEISSNRNSLNVEGIRLPGYQGIEERVPRARTKREQSGE